MASVQRTERVIEPSRGLSSPDRRELWAHRDLIYLLARRDVAIRYKQSVIGVPGRCCSRCCWRACSASSSACSRRSNGLERALPVFAVLGDGDVAVLHDGGQQVVREHRDQRDLISKVYFPRLVIPIAAVLAPVVDFAIALVVVLVVIAAPTAWCRRCRCCSVPARARSMLALRSASASGSRRSTSGTAISQRRAVPAAGRAVRHPVVYPFATIPDGHQAALRPEPDGRRHRGCPLDGCCSAPTSRRC